MIPRREMANVQAAINEFDQLLTATGSKSNSSSIRAASWEDGSNSSGFGALPALGSDNNGVILNFGSYAAFWSATPNGSDFAYSVYVSSDGADLLSYYGVDYAFSVRYLKGAN